MIRKLFWLISGIVLTLVGVVGLLVPVLPGILPLLGAVACFSLASARFHRHVGKPLGHRMARHPRLRDLSWRWRASAGLRPLQRARLLVLAAVAAALPRSSADRSADRSAGRVR
ncbi:MAG: DUF454 family protein [Pseudomonadales bacterium]